MFTKKILCIGSETRDTDLLVNQLAAVDDAQNHGLISNSSYTPNNHGYYHTTIVDLLSADIINLAKNFDLVIMLDQSIDSYPHWKTYVNTFRLMLEIETSQVKTQFRDNTNNKDILRWHVLLSTNKSLCLYPFINLINDYGSAVQCQKVSTPVTKIDSIVDWATDPEFAKIRNAMLAGTPIPDKCNICYEREETGQQSARQFESLEWAMELRLKTEHDLKNIKAPVLYEIRPSNKCNIMCRMCDDRHSHLIEQENIKIGIPINTDQWRMQDFPYEKINFTTAKRIYWAGGEPTVMPEFYAFLRKCIKQKTTDFYLSIGTNGQKLSDTLFDLLKEFPIVNFSVSFDGYKKVNDYIRWGSDFEKIRSNCFRILEHGHQLAFQTVFSMYNATRIHEVYEFYDHDFPGCNTLVQPAGNLYSYLGPWHHPLRDQVLESMYRCRDTKVYYANGRNTDSLVEELIDRFEDHDYDPKILGKFFAYNDTLDRTRGSRLADYIPELDPARKFIRHE